MILFSNQDPLLFQGPLPVTCLFEKPELTVFMICPWALDLKRVFSPTLCLW